MRSEQEVNHAIEAYADMVRRVCLYRLKNKEDTEDVFQNVFLKYMLYEGEFRNVEHEKAWILRVSINACKDYLKDFFRRNVVPLELLDGIDTEISEDHLEILDAVLSLPRKYKDVIYLYYYEGYPAAEIGEILGKKENTIYSLLSRGRKLLKKELGGEEIGK